MNPTIDLSQIYNIFFNVQSLAVLNPDGVAWTMPKAIMRVVKTDMTDNIGDKTYGQRTKCHFLFFKTIIPDNVIPQINTRITDSNGTHWYVNDVDNIYFGNVLKLYCESRAGVGVEDEQYPNAAYTTTTTTSTTPPVNDCRNNNVIIDDIKLIDQNNICAKEGLLSNWFVENLALNTNESAYASFEIQATGVVDFVADGQGLLNGSCLVTINGVVVGGGNYAGTTLSYSTGVTAGDVVVFHWYTADPIIFGACNVTLQLNQSTTTSTTTT